MERAFLITNFSGKKAEPLLSNKVICKGEINWTEKKLY